MQLPLSDGRAVRMLQALLAAADPLDRMHDLTTPADVYMPVAVSVLDALRNGADVRRIVFLLNEQVSGAPQREAFTLVTVVPFAQAACDWWAEAQSRWLDPVAI